jgi:hypothetical protein
MSDRTIPLSVLKQISVHMFTRWLRLILILACPCLRFYSKYSAHSLWNWPRFLSTVMNSARMFDSAYWIEYLKFTFCDHVNKGADFMIHTVDEIYTVGFLPPSLWIRPMYKVVECCESVLPPQYWSHPPQPTIDFMGLQTNFLWVPPKLS